MEQAKRTRASIASTTPQVDLSMENFQMFDEDIVQQRRDKKLARERPEKYCANRCVATGNCDVFEGKKEKKSKTLNTAEKLIHIFTSILTST